MLFSDVKTLVYLKSHSLEVYVDNVEQVASLPFPSEVIRHLELLDRDKLEKSVVDFFAGLGLEHQSAKLVLASDVLFTKILMHEGAESDPPQNFFDIVPLETEKVARMEIPGQKETLLLATNRQLYQSIVEILEGQGWKIEAVVPITIFGQVDSAQPLSPELVSEILKDNKMTKSTNLLTTTAPEIAPIPLPKEEVETEESDDAPEEKGSNKKQYVMLALTIFLLVGASIYAAINMGFLPNPLQSKPAPSPNQAAQTEEVPAIAPEQTASDSAAIETPKSDLTVQILNGSGVAGQAGKVRDLLTPLGYQNFELGNSDQNTDATTLSLKPVVSMANKTELVTELEKSFSVVITSEASAEAKFDIIITTGK